MYAYYTHNIYEYFTHTTIYIYIYIYIVEEWVFHGTSKDVVLNIVQEGFKIGGKDGIPVRHGASYGEGVYTAGGPATPMQLVNQHSISQE
jgi:hypothetical protein